ncbi:hypothetical protein MPLSOD_20242 [Mesorhizobium sp. SOD10]|nr:hypothetical protein MPLSOD_20242 [Mesorhizobium sp. SOD10]
MVQCTKRIAAMQKRPFNLWAGVPIYAASNDLTNDWSNHHEPDPCFP